MMKHLTIWGTKDINEINGKEKGAGSEAQRHSVCLVCVRPWI